MKCLRSPLVLSDRAGSSYVVVLVVVAVLSAFALTFVTQTGLRVAVGADRTANAQAAYLAEAAVHHAMWRLLHEPGFPADETVYSMHTLGDGRYGYQVRAPTPTTIATIATVGVVGDAVVRQSWGQYVMSRIITLYAESTSRTPAYRRLVGATWSAPGATVDMGSTAITWVELRGSPHDDSAVAAVIGDDDVTRLSRWDGAAWTTATAFATGKKDYKSVDIAYESSSGDALVVAWNATPGQLRYTVWAGTAWTVPATVSTGEASDVTFVRMASHPKTDEILLVAVHANQDVRLLRWNGTGFVLLPELESDAASGAPFVAEVLYETTSGHAIIVWGRRNQNRCGFSVWNGTALVSGGLLPNLGGEGLFLRGASHPDTDELVLAVLDDGNDLSVAAWNGVAWSDSREVETSADQPAGTEPSFAVAWEDFGEEAIVAWARSGSSNLAFMQWPKDSTLASVPLRTGPAFGAGIRSLRMHPVDGTEDVVVFGGTATSELRYTLWRGDRFVADPAQTLSTTLSTTAALPFGVTRSAS